MTTLVEIIDDPSVDRLEVLQDARPFRRIVANDKLTLEAKVGYALRRYELAYGSDGTATRGRHSQEDDDGLTYGRALVEQFRDLFCADNRYEAEREIVEMFATGRTAGVAYISSLIAPTLGVAAPGSIGGTGTAGVVVRVADFPLPDSAAPRRAEPVAHAGIGRCGARRS
jgi:hypothetical protein